MSAPAFAHPEVLEKLAPTSRAAYQKAWAAFEAWCRARRQVALPANATTVTLYLRSVFSQGKQATARTVAPAALRAYHRAAGHKDPTKDVDLKALRRDMASLSRPKRKTRFLTLPDVQRVLELAASAPLGERDLPLCTLVLLGRLTPTEAVALRWGDVRFAGINVELDLARTLPHGDRASSVRTLFGQEPPIPCPVRALRAWRDLHPNEGDEEPVFKARGYEHALTPSSAANVLRRYLEEAGYSKWAWKRVNLQASVALPTPPPRVDTPAPEPAALAAPPPPARRSFIPR